MLHENTVLIKQLFNLGKLITTDAAYYAKRGYQIICRNGKVEEVILPIDACISQFTKAVV